MSRYSPGRSQSFLPRPWGLPFLDPLTNPIDGAFVSGVWVADDPHPSSTVPSIAVGGIRWTLGASTHAPVASNAQPWNGHRNVPELPFASSQTWFPR